MPWSHEPETLEQKGHFDERKPCSASHVKDANGRENIAGVGINIAQRVMDCGDAGHILVSKRVADDLAQQRRWQPYIHAVSSREAGIDR